MDLVQKFFANWESKSLEIILSELQEEIEKKVGSLVDEDNIEKVFCKGENNGNIWDGETFRQFLELHSILSGVPIDSHPVVEFLETAAIWNQSSELEAIEEKLSDEQKELLESWIDKINELEPVKYLFLLKKDAEKWTVSQSLDMKDYIDGSLNAIDMAIRKLIIDNMDAEIRLMIIATDEDGDYCVEI